MSLSLAAPEPRRFRLAPPFDHLAALAMTAVAALLTIGLEQVLPVPNLSLVFVLPVVVAAATLGWGPSLTAVASSVLAYNFFLIEPRYTFRVADPSNVLALLLLLVVAAMVSAVAAQARRRALDGQRAADQAAALSAFATGLVGAKDLAALAKACAETLTRLFGVPAMVLTEEAGALTVRALAGGAQPGPADLDAAGWSLAAGLPSRGGAYPVGETDFDFWPVTSSRRRKAVIGLVLSDPDAGRPDQPERLVETVASYLAVALDREALMAQTLRGEVERANERVKADLLAAVSHDLKTPLSTILFSLQSLRTFAHDEASRAELLAVAETEAERLSGLVGKLLDVGRLEAGALAVKPEVATTADLVAQALHRVRPALAGRPVDLDLAAGGDLWVDPALFETALGNVLENAVKYAPGPLQIVAGVEDETGWIEVRDRGPGFTGRPEALFEKFVRGVQGDGRPPGTGLGLSIVRGFIEAQGGRLEAANRDDGPGARVRLVAPLAGRT